MEKKALGKGLEALLPALRSSESDQMIQMIPITQIVPNRFQPRKIFLQNELERLADSIKQNGMLQPILVRRTGDGLYELIAGERRFRSAKLANLSTVPVMIRHSQDDESSILALVENIQRKDLNPIEESKAYTQLIEEFGLTQEMVAHRVGRDRSSIANIVRLVTLPHQIQQFLECEQLTLGHAKVLLSMKNSQTQIDFAQQVLRDQLSVRDLERLIKRRLTGFKKASNKNDRSFLQQCYSNVEEQLRKRLGTKIAIRPRKRGGELTVTYYSDEDLTRIVDVIVS